MKIGLALGAGAAKGLAHLGVLSVLEEENIPIHCIAGSSMGSIVGGFYAAGLELDRMIKLACNLKWGFLTDFTIPQRGFIGGRRLLQFFRLLSKGYYIEDLPIPYAAVATDIENGEEVQIKKGPLAEALRASSSIPGIYQPFYHQGRWLVDGGVLNRVPCSAVQKMGAEYVIAVNIEFAQDESRVQSIYDIIFKTYEIMGKEILKGKIIDADLVISPAVGHISAMQIQKAKECIELGEKAARDAISLMPTEFNF